jgi:hypothetical protein
MTTTQKTERAEAISSLRKNYGIRAGKTIYTQVLHVSSSGMSRTISLHVISKGRSFRISHLVAKACGYKLDRERMGIRSHGCGMDMCFEAVYNLGRVMFPEGFGKGSAHKGDGGYALRKEDL